MDSAGITQLCRAAAFDHPANDITVRETHISWVILCGDYAYKLKKPVDFGFLDFSDLAQRKHYCEEELRLNRRFSPEVYLAVVPVTQGPDGPVMGGAGEPVDYAVKMRRFDESQLLDSIAARDGLNKKLVRSIARELARLHAELPRCFPEPEGEEAGTPAALQAALRQNFSQLRQYPLRENEQQLLDAIEPWSEQRYDVLLPAMQQRVRDGWVIDGHGDDHLGNMAIIDGQVRLFDCIEFNADFRIVDSIAEVALLDMDLNARGHPGESHRLLTDYLEYRGDFAGLALLDLYRVYFALVRAKVALLQHSTDDPALLDTKAYGEARHYLEIARRYCQPRRRFLGITYGLSGSGKSTAAGKLVEASGAVRIRSDVERKRLFGLAPEERSEARDNARLYSTDMSRKTFERLADLAETILDAGFPVIVDGTFLHSHVRDDFQGLATRLKVPFAILHCVTDEGKIRDRLQARESSGVSVSEAGIAIMEQQRDQLQPLSDSERQLATEVRAGADPDDIWQSVRSKMQ
jgi:aminoglycoside phosphotransferase family enzyme/adenylate kinase family enzyme